MLILAGIGVNPGELPLPFGAESGYFDFSMRGDPLDNDTI
jgi:hypothetical protein